MCPCGRINGEKRAGRREGTEAREATDHVVFPVILCHPHRLPVPHPETDGKDDMIEAEQRASLLPIRRKAAAAARNSGSELYFYVNFLHVFVHCPHFHTEMSHPNINDSE